MPSKRPHQGPRGAADHPGFKPGTKHAPHGGRNPKPASNPDRRQTAVTTKLRSLTTELSTHHRAPPHRAGIEPRKDRSNETTFGDGNLGDIGPIEAAKPRDSRGTYDRRKR